MKKQYYCICNFKGKVVEYGDGVAPNTRRGQTIHYFDTEQKRDDFDPVRKNKNLMAALPEMDAILAVDRKPALETKYREARNFIQESHEAMDITDRSIVDPDFYPALYDEYWSTFDLVDWTPLELAQNIIKSAEKPVTEGDLRRRKLLAEKAIKENS